MRSYVRRGAAIDLVLERGRENRSQFVLTRIRGGREAIFWQTARGAKQARPMAELTARASGVAVRRFPGSRSNAAAARGAIPEIVAALGMLYRWDERLGGRRRLTAAQDATSPDTWWQVAAFRAYAGWTRSPDFRAAIEELVATPGATAIMCSEAVWWRCHRRVISDVLVGEYGMVVCHLMHDGRLSEHRLSDGARKDADGRLVWDGPSAL